MNKAIDAFLNTLDPHSNFLDPKTYRSMLESTNGEFFGVGIVIDNTRKPRDKYLTIVDTIPEGPADKSGIKPLDRILEIDGKPLEGMTTDQATALLKGERHTAVEIKILREKEADLLTFSVKRDVVKEQNSLSFYIKDQNIAYLSLSMFSHNAVKQIESLLKRAQKNNYKALILDLRNNSGGLLTAAVDIAGMFLPSNSLVVTTKDKNNAVTGAYKTKREAITQKMVPLFVLINNYTASAAEILAGCLQIHAQKPTTNSLVFLVGTKTFGKGSVQEVIPVENNSAIKITTSLYYLPNDVTIQGIGIDPDFVIERYLPPTEQMQWFTKYYGREHALTNSIKAHPEETKDSKQAIKPTGTRWIDRAQKMLETDNQLRETIALINLFATLKERFPQDCSHRSRALPLLHRCRLHHDQLSLEEITS
jgi:carboxyl-terminal processing protease